MTKNFSVKKVLKNPFFLLGLIAVLWLLVRMTPPFHDYQGNIAVYESSGTKYAAVDPDTLPVKLESPFEQGLVRKIIDDEPVPQFVSINYGLNSIAANAQTGNSTTPPAPPVDCNGSEHTLLLDNGNTILRNVRWKTRDGKYGCGMAIPHKEATGHFWFFDQENIELTCKALNAVGLNAHYWVFCGGLTDVEWWMTAVNNANPSITKQYYSAAGKMASFGDTAALPSGSNVVTKFNPNDCGGYYEIPKGSVASTSAYVADPQGDSISATVHVLRGGNSFNVEQRWANPIPGAGASLPINISSNTPGEYLIGIEATDGKSLIPSLCTFKFRVK